MKYDNFEWKVDCSESIHLKSERLHSFDYDDRHGKMTHIPKIWLSIDMRTILILI